MPTPTSSLASLRPEIGSGFEEFDLAMDRQGFISQRVLPMFDVAKRSGTFPKITIESLLQNRETKRSNRGGYSRGDFSFTEGTFACSEHGLEEPVDDNEAEIYEDFFEMEMVAAERAYDGVMRAAEKRVADLVFNATTWSGADLTTGITHEWDDATNAVPTVNVEAAVQKIYDNSGLWANTLIINRKVYRNLRNCDDIIDRCKAQGFMDVRAGEIGTSQLASVFDLPNIIVAGGTKNISNEGQDADLSPIWSGEYAMVCRLETGRDLRRPTIGRTFRWKREIFESYRDETVRADIMRARHDVDEKILYPEAGHLLSNITT